MIVVEQCYKLLSFSTLFFKVVGFIKQINSVCWRWTLCELKVNHYRRGSGDEFWPHSHLHVCFGLMFNI